MNESQQLNFSGPEINDIFMVPPNIDLASGMVRGETPRRGYSDECPIETPDASSSYRAAAVIAKALGVDKKTIHNRAKREGWKHREIGNRLEYLPPHDIELLLSPIAPQHAPREEGQIKFTELTNAETRKTVILRERAVMAVSAFPGSKTTARANVVATFILKHPGFQISVRSLERWESQYQPYGIDGLVDQKQGRVGRKSAIGALDENTRATLVARGKAIAMEKRSVAAAVRELAAQPNLPAALRRHLHDAHASKSHVTPSVRAALRTAPLTGALAQGPNAARLASRWTPRDYSQLQAGDVFTSDDMTSNVMCWTEWPNARGFIIGQPQILPVLDVRSLRALNVRVIMREGGQYSGDDCWGLFGDVFDTFGMPKAMLLEFGHWQSKRVKGHNTGVTAEDRIGGLASLGIDLHPSFDPRSKGRIEGWFNIFQRHCDAFPGYGGRDQRKQMPEHVKKAVALVKHGEHPSKYFPHLKDFADHVQTVMENLNHERQDGQILRGVSPLEQWASDAPRLAQLPDESKWLYRSAFSVTQVTRNGVRVTQGSGKKMQVYYYDNPELLVPLQGQKVVVFWNDHNPDADACICLPLKGGHYKFHGLAKRVQPLSAFNASKQELSDEAQRKKAAMHYARTELRSIQPELQRNSRLIRTDESTDQVASEIQAAAARQEEIELEEARSRQRIHKVEVTEEMRDAATEQLPQEEVLDLDKFTELFND
ncbi:MAG: hypothetical protein ACTHMT_13745 [Verrucomicrobiota bacterium]